MAELLTREGLTQRELALSRQLATDIAAALDPKPTIHDMLGWVDRREASQYASALTCTLINGSSDPGQARDLAVGRKAVELLALVAEHEDDVRTLFKAKAWKGGRP